jgi:hypothetical protein
VLAEVEESSPARVDARLRKLGGMVFRRLRTEVIEDQLVRESAAFEAKLKAFASSNAPGPCKNREHSEISQSQNKG